MLVKFTIYFYLGRCGIKLGIQWKLKQSSWKVELHWSTTPFSICIMGKISLFWIYSVSLQRYYHIAKA